jgi:hypothetical protein
LSRGLGGVRLSCAPAPLFSGSFRHSFRRSWRDEPDVNGGERHSLIWEDLAPFAKRLIGGDHQRPMFISRADEFEENAGFDLVLTDVCKIVQNHQMILIELGDRRFERKLAASDLRSAGVLRALSPVAQGARRAENPAAGDGHPLTPRRFSSVLALEIEPARRPAEDAGGHSPADSRNERCQPVVGSTTDSRRTAQTWN